MCRRFNSSQAHFFPYQKVVAMAENTLAQVVAEDVKKRRAHTLNEGVKEVLSWLAIILTAVLAAMLLTKFVIVNAEVTSGSMESTIMTGDRVLGLRCVYWFEEPSRGDIVFFQNPDNENEIYVKRLIGVPGDTIEIKGGKTYVNGQLLSEPYLNETPNELDFGPYVVPDGSYFMLGDNRNHSHDSRYWTHTFVTRSEILGKAYWVYYPTVENISASFEGR